MRKKVSEMTAADKTDFLGKSKEAMVRQNGIPWEQMEARMLEELDNIFDDAKFVKMDPDSLIDGAYTRKAFGNKKPELVDYMLWMLTFVTHSEYVEW